jgi:hypothetical protein
LLLGKIVEAVKPDGLEDLLGVVGRLSRGARWRKLLVKHGEYMSSSIPSFTPTRWYSLAKLVVRSLRLWEPLQEFLVKCLKRDPFDEAMRDRMEDLSQILGTFANATASLESDEFGTLSLVYDWLFLIKQICLPIARRWPAVALGLSEANEHWLQYLGDNEGEERGQGMVLAEGVTLTDRVVVASFLNPASAYERSLSPGNQRQALVLVQQALRAMQVPVPGSGPVGAGREASAVPGRRASTGLTLEDLQIKSEDGSVRTELDRFIAMDRTGLVGQGGQFNLLNWWNDNKISYPKLFDLAMRFLSVPATSAAIEHQFSKAKKINSPNRRSLTAPKLEAIVFLKEHLQVLDAIPGKQEETGADSESSDA